MTHWERPWCWERLKAGGKGDDRVWHGWMVSPTRWTWVWVDSGSWWWTEKPSLLQSMGSQRVRHDWATELADWFIGTTDAEAESRALILWPPDAKSQLIGKDPDAGKDWRKEEKGIREGEMIGWHHRLNGQVFEQASGHCEGQGSLECYSPWGHKESDMTAWLNSIGIFLFSFLFFLHNFFILLCHRISST